MTTFSSTRPVFPVKSIFIALYVLHILFTSTEGCEPEDGTTDGYKIKLNKLEHCDSKAIYKITNLKVELTKECSVFFKGCVELTAAITSLRLTYEVKKSGMMVPFKGDRDVNIQSTALKVCSQKGDRIDISSYKDKFRLAEGQYTGTVKLDSNSGKGCFKFDVEFRRGK